MEPIVTESPSVLARQLSVYGIPYPASSTERRKNKVVKTYGVVWREPDRDQFGLSIPVNQTTRGAEAMRLGGRPTQRGAPHDGDQRPGRAEEVGSCRLGTTRAAGSTRRR